MSCIVVLSTVSNLDEAKRISHIIVENKIAACVNIVPRVVSVYSWKEEVVEDEEVLMIIKTKKALYNNLEYIIKKQHSYEVPEIIAFDMVNGLESYFNWINEVTM